MNDATTQSEEFRVHGTATRAVWREFGTGSQGIQIVFDLAEPLPTTGERTAAGILWTTPKAAEMTAKTLRAAGVDLDQKGLTTGTLLDGIPGKVFSLSMVLEPTNEFHKHGPKWTVKWIREVERPAQGDLVALLRGDTRQVDRPYDEEVPF
jgi:hypothetical protein